MGLLPPDQPPDDFEPDENDTDGRAGSNQSGSGNGHGSHEPPNDENFDLPEDYDHDRDRKFVPSLDDLQQAAINALDREFSFVILYRKDPKEIVERLDEIAAVVLAASQIDGEHQEKAVRLGLALEIQYWLARNKLGAWREMFLPLVPIALRVKKGDELRSRVFHAWSVYAVVSGNQAETDHILLNALECAEDAKREDIKLLVRSERFNMDAGTMDPDQALTQAESILADARRLKYPLVQGRVYLSLALICRRYSQREMVFTYAQQALLYFSQENFVGFETMAVSTMLGVLLEQNDHSAAYAARLLGYLETLAQRSVNPWFQFMVEHQRAAFYYRQADYERARQCALKAWAISQSVKVGVEGIRSKHLLGLIQTSRRRWKLAESHLKATCRWYEKNKKISQALHAKHAVAYIPRVQGDLPRALVELEQVLAEAGSSLEGSARDYLVQVVEKDILDVKQELEAGLQQV